MKSFKLFMIIFVVGLIVIAGITYTRFHDISYIPMTISIDGNWYKSSVYLKVDDNEYNLSEDEFLQKANSEDNEIKTFITQLQNNDAEGILTNIHPDVTSKKKNKALNYVNGAIQYWGMLEDKRINRRFSYSNEKVYVVSGFLKQKLYVLTIRFALDSNDNAFKYVPFSMDNFAKTIINMWVKQYANQKELYEPVSAFSVSMLTKSFTYKVNDKSAKDFVYPAAAIEFNGKNFNEQSSYTSAIKKLIGSMRKALEENDFNKYLSFHTVASNKYLRKSFSTTKESELFDNFKKTFFSFTPAFVIDASPVYIVYSKDSTNGYSLSYVFKDNRGNYKSANAGVLPISFQIFNDKQFTSALEDIPPFSSLKNK